MNKTLSGVAQSALRPVVESRVRVTTHGQQPDKHDSYCLQAEHGQFWASSAELEMLEADIKALEHFGWFKDEHADGWSAWV